MKILFLGSPDSPLIQFLKKEGETVLVTEERINSGFVLENKIEFIISYGYTQMIRKDVLDLFDRRIINLHISYLPWNKGSDPNFWSVIDQTPRGITIHFVDEGLDTGDILLQETVDFPDTESLRSSYLILNQQIQALFMKHWHELKNNRIPSRQQTEKGTVHRVMEKETFIREIRDRFLDIPISELITHVRAEMKRSSNKPGKN